MIKWMCMLALAGSWIGGNPMAKTDCSSLLTTAMVESDCGLTGIVERVTSVEQSGQNCNRSYRLGKGWGDDLIFIAVPTPGKADLSYVKKAYANKGIEKVNGIGDEAYTMNFTDELTKRQEHQLLFLKGNYLIELRTKESANKKTPCPCFEMEKLKKLGASIAEKIK